MKMSKRAREVMKKDVGIDRFTQFRHLNRDGILLFSFDDKSGHSFLMSMAINLPPSRRCFEKKSRPEVAGEPEAPDEPEASKPEASEFAGRARI